MTLVETSANKFAIISPQARFINVDFVLSIFLTFKKLTYEIYINFGVFNWVSCCFWADGKHL